MSDSEEKEGRLSRWSKRKMAVARGEDLEAEATPSSSDPEEISAERQAELLANREAAEAVDLDELTDGSDFSVFFKDGVPELLKRQAMAILWRSNPVFANVDGLVDYDDDFANPDLIMKTFKSAYQIGQGYLQKDSDAELEPQSDKPEDRLPDGAEEDIATAEPSLEEETDVDQDEDAEATAGQNVSPPEADFDEGEGVAVENQKPFPRVSLRTRLELDG